MNFSLNRSRIVLLAFLSGILLSIGWPSAGFAPLLFIALVPILLAEHASVRRKQSLSAWFVLLMFYLTFFTFNLLTTWWVKYASFFGAVAAILCNALFMAVVFLGFYFVKKKFGKKLGYVALIAFWLSFEYLHMRWDLSWPWLTLGNGFAGWPLMIQWYEFTGVLGGSVWILVVNIFVFEALASLFSGKLVQHYTKLILYAGIVITIPVLYSVIRYYSYEEEINPVNVAVIQPNIDPYNEKFSGMSSADQLKRIISLASTVADSATDYIVAPETAMPDGIWEEQLQDHPHIQTLKRFQETFPNANWVIGLASSKYYPDSNLRTATARKFTQSPEYYDSYNTAMQLEKSGDIQLHHKSKLVPGVEKMPFPSIFKHIEAFAIDLGGISGSLGVQDTPSVFTNKSNNQIVAPVICYESIYGDYISEYVRQGASLIFIITNDGWWSDTPGYRQHLKYGTLRAIEMRRSIARSANTGISCFINQRGDILQPTKWWTPDAIKSTINANYALTVYARIGDVIGLVAAIISVVILIFLAFIRRKLSV